MMNNWRPVLLTAVAAIVFVVSSPVDDKTAKTEIYHANGPIISPSKKEIILQKGQNYTLTCQGKWNITFKQQELGEEKIGGFNITERYTTHENADYKYEVVLDLINVDRYTIGYYACNYSSAEGDVINSLAEEPTNTEHVSYIYIYVNGTDSLFAPMREVVTGRSGYYVVECRPTTPDVEVRISVAPNKTTDYLNFSPKIGFIMKACSKVAYECYGYGIGNKPEKKQIRSENLKDLPQPKVTGESKEFLPGETFSLNCTVKYIPNIALNLTWKYPNDVIKASIIEKSNNNDEVKNGILYFSITIKNATKEHAGTYTCYAKNHCAEKPASFKKTYKDKPYLIIDKFYLENIVETPQKVFHLNVGIYSYPPANYTYFRNGVEIKTKNNETYTIKDWDKVSHEATLIIRRSSGNYTIFASNGHVNNTTTIDVRFKTEPVVKFGSNDKTCLLNMKTSLQCEISGYPMPNVTWIFYEHDLASPIITKSSEIKVSSIDQATAILDIQCQAAGNITCKASNSLKKNEVKVANETRNLIVYEVPDGFGIFNQSHDKIAWFSELQDVTIKCMASKYKYTNVTWLIEDNDERGIVKYSNSTYSHVAELRIKQISLNDNGTYVCSGETNDGVEKNDSINIYVAQLSAPVIILTNNFKDEVNVYQPIEMHCLAQGVPRPTIKWFKDDGEIKEKNVKIFNYNFNRTTVKSSINFTMQEENRGTYECVVSTDTGDVVSKTAMLVLKEAAVTNYLIAIAAIIIVLIIVVIILTCKIKKDKQFHRELKAAGLLYFKTGVTKSLNPELGIDEQAELLPYNEKFEFPIGKLILGKQLGAGAFGVVYKAEARGIINAEETTPVAVKMVKKTADNMYIKALASELKIMVHLGKHINIVNLLGACTKNVVKRELLVIVEYCKFGNIHNYMQRHREVFIDQFSDSNKEKSFGKVNRGYDSTGSTGVQSDYGTANTQATDHTFLTNNTNRTSRKNVPSQPTEVVKASEGYIAPEWRSNYESDYVYDARSPRPLTSRDLLAWSFQIARGMEYLASRKVLHGDLAARNILLADDNVVKICDFGLARSIYKNDEYKKEENSLLPLKWLAIECMTDRIFSTQSDVWSFGIVLWEIFSLAKTPYPNMCPKSLLQFLNEGHRLEKPAYSDDRIYNLMKRCWQPKPMERPTFTQLQETLGTFLEENVRNHYVDLNTAYMDLNSKAEGQEDYLAMLSAPDYNNMVTPSPHHYVNDTRSFFPPTPTKEDAEGYLQMSPGSNHDIFSPKPTPGTKFDFESRKFNGRPSEASSVGSELTPMLTLNNLARSGSDSDHEGNASPYLNVCPRIDEETDDVFETKLNAKNVQNSAVSNPTYITFDIDVEKKPIDINNYVNIKPNGLVK